MLFPIRDVLMNFVIYIPPFLEHSDATMEGQRQDYRAVAPSSY